MITTIGPEDKYDAREFRCEECEVHFWIESVFRYGDEDEIELSSDSIGFCPMCGVGEKKEEKILEFKEEDEEDSGWESKILKVGDLLEIGGTILKVTKVVDSMEGK